MHCSFGNVALSSLEISLSQHLSQMQGSAGGILGDLLAATKTVGNDDSLRSSLPDGGHEDALSQSLRNLELFAFKAKGTGHAAASGIEEGDFGSRALEEVEFGVQLHE